MTLSLKLYGYWRSSAAWRVRAALAYKRLAYDSVSVNLAASEHLEPGFAALSAIGEIPQLEVRDDDDAPHLIGQSVAIIEYLDERFPQPPLLPKDAIEKATVRQIVQLVNASIHPLQNLNVLRKLATDFGQDDSGKRAWAAHYIERGLKGLEAVLSRTAGELCYGSSLTMADLFVAPQLFNAERFGVSRAPFPTISRIERRMLSHSAIADSHPNRQADAPREVRA